MTKAELLQLLAPLSDDATIILSDDPEGNGYRKLEDVSWDMKYYEGEVGLAELDDASIADGYSEADVLDHSDAVDAIIFY
jgi:hypothetical protein